MTTAGRTHVSSRSEHFDEAVPAPVEGGGQSAQAHLPGSGRGRTETREALRLDGTETRAALCVDGTETQAALRLDANDMTSLPAGCGISVPLSLVGL